MYDTYFIIIKVGSVVINYTIHIHYQTINSYNSYPYGVLYSTVVEK